MKNREFMMLQLFAAGDKARVCSIGGAKWQKLNLRESQS